MKISTNSFARCTLAIAGACTLVVGGVWFAQRQQSVKFTSHKLNQTIKTATEDVDPLGAELFIVTSKADVSPYGGYTIMYSLDSNLDKPGKYWAYDVNVGLETAAIEKEMKTLPGLLHDGKIVQKPAAADKDLAAKADYTVYLFAHGGDYDVLLQNIYLVKQSAGYELDYTSDVPPSVINTLMKRDFIGAIDSGKMEVKKQK